MGPGATFHTYCHTLNHPQQWGIQADVTQFRAIDKDLVKALGCLHTIKMEIEELHLNRSLIQACLEMAHATQQAKAHEPLVLGQHVTFCGGAWKKTQWVNDQG